LGKLIEEGKGSIDLMGAICKATSRNFRPFLGAIITGLLTSGMLLPAIAQVTSDGTINTTVKPNGNNFSILNGIEKGNNLFHSFREFSIPTGGSAIFYNSTDVVNIINRVTGGNISNIDGLIKTQGNANLFLINPAGIIFGKNARLDIGGSFLGTTASSIQFADGFEFSAVNPQSTPLLTVSVPVGLQMSNAGVIEFNGSGYSLNRLSNSALRAASNSNLQVKPQKTLTLLGGNITMMGSRVSTSSGKIELASVSEGFINLYPTSGAWEFGYEKALRLGDIKLDQAIIDALSPGGGSIHLQARNIFLHNGSNVVIQNQGLKPSGGISLNATESLEVSGLHPKQFLFSDIRSESLLGFAGDISIFTQRLKLSGGEGINILTLNTQGGNIMINASESIKLESYPLNPKHTSQIETVTYGGGKAGNIFLSTGNLTILDGTRVSSITRSQADSGNVTIDAKSIEVAGATSDFLESLISAGSLAKGNAGNLLINTEQLRIRDGGRVDSSTAAQGNAGSVTINAKKIIEVDGSVPGSINPSLIISSANVLDESLRRIFKLPPIPTGKSGNLTINTPTLRVVNGAEVTVRNDGTGNAGSLKVNANSIFLDTKGSITAATKSGEGGNITINLQDSLVMRHHSAINTESLGIGNGGNISINSPIIAGLENSDIVANAVEGNGGNIDITTQGIFGLKFRDRLTSENDISASSEFGVNGTVDIQNFGVDPSSGLVELPLSLVDSSQQITAGCSANQGSRFVATGRGGVPQNPNQQIGSDVYDGLNLRTWADIRDISAYQKAGEVTAKISPSPATLMQATSWHRNAQGKIELVADKSSTQVQQPLTCAGVPRS
jgi:filamentous hemagglutinin family protein